MSTTLSPNMNLPVPGVGNEPGPDYATDINNCLSIIDQHSHSAGSGVQVTPGGININTDLPFNGFSITTLLKASFSSQVSALTGTNFASVVGGNLYFNDGSGNQIPITAAGGVAGSPGSIGSLTSPASATYSAGSKTFTWASGSSKAAAMDNGAVTIRETDVASAKGITLASPTALAADIQLTLPAALPGSTQYVTSSSAGILSFTTPDGIAAAITSTGTNSLISTMGATGANLLRTNTTRSTGTTVGVGGVAISANSGTINVNGGTPGPLTVATAQITTSGRPVQLNFISSGPPYSLSSSQLFSNSSTIRLKYFRDATEIGAYELGVPGSSAYMTIPPMTDNVTSGTYTYSLTMTGIGGAQTAQIRDVKLVAYEL